MDRKPFTIANEAVRQNAMRKSANMPTIDGVVGRSSAAIGRGVLAAISYRR